MNLQNKKTGEIGFLISAKNRGYYTVVNDGWHICGDYNSLAELNKEWKDASEEPKEHYFISNCGEIKPEKGHSLHRDKRIKIDNDFKSKEEAKKAVEKLKAWKRLKDARLKFTDFGYNLDELSSSTISADGKICFEMICYEDFADDLELLFGGEE